MLASAVPTKFDVPWASSATSGFITSPIPLGPTAPGRASLQFGFPETTFEPEASGGNPPYGADANGILNEVTKWQQWNQAGGWVGYDAAFSAVISGYPNGAILNSATPGHFWISGTDNNASDPDTGGANWTPFPDLLIQQQGGNWAPTDSGALNAAKVTLSPLPASWAAMEGAPIRFLIANTNTTTAVTLELIGVSGSLGTKVLKNTDGTAMVIGQLTAGGLVEGFYDGTVVQVASPGKPPPSGSSVLPPGAIVLCPVEVPFSGTLECNGASYLRSAFPNLFNVISTKYGTADDDHFNVPDMRGIFVRGWDHGRGLDPNASTRAAPGTLAPTRSGATGAAGDFVGTTEGTAIGVSSIQIQNPTFNWVAGSLNLSAPGANFAGRSLPIAASASMALTEAPIWPPGSPTSNVVFLGSSGDPWQLNNSANLLSIYTDIVTGGGPGTVPTTNFLAASITGWIAGTLNGNSTETRPVNINMMYVIAY